MAATPASALTGSLRDRSRAVLSRLGHLADDPIIALAQKGRKPGGEGADRLLRRRRLRALRQITQDEVELHLRPLGGLVAAVFGMQVIWHLWAGRGVTMAINAICLVVSVLVVLLPAHSGVPLALWKVEAALVFIVVVGAMCQDAHSCGVFDLWVLALGGGVLGVAVRGVRCHMLIHAMVAVWVVIRTLEEGWDIGLWRTLRSLGFTANSSAEFPIVPGTDGRLPEGEDMLLRAAARRLGSWWFMTALTVRLLAVLLATVASRLFADRLSRERAMCLAVDALADGDAEEVERLAAGLPSHVRLSLANCLARQGEGHDTSSSTGCTSSGGPLSSSRKWPRTPAPQEAQPGGALPLSPGQWWLPLTSRSLPTIPEDTLASPGPPDGEITAMAASRALRPGRRRRRARSAPPCGEDEEPPPEPVADTAAAGPPVPPALVPRAAHLTAPGDAPRPEPAPRGSAPPPDSPPTPQRARRDRTLPVPAPSSSPGAGAPPQLATPSPAAQPAPPAPLGSALQLGPPACGAPRAAPAAQGASPPDCGSSVTQSSCSPEQVAAAPSQPPEPVCLPITDWRGPHRPLQGLRNLVQQQPPGVPLQTGGSAFGPIGAPGGVSGEFDFSAGQLATAAGVLPTAGPWNWAAPLPTLAAPLGPLDPAQAAPRPTQLSSAPRLPTHDGALPDAHPAGQEPSECGPEQAEQLQGTCSGSGDAPPATTSGLPPVVHGDIPPCPHNDWDSTRSKRGWHMLRCRTCKAQWRVFTRKAEGDAALAFCPAFRSTVGCSLGAACPMPHVHRYKTTTGWSHSTDTRRAKWQLREEEPEELCSCGLVDSHPGGDRGSSCSGGGGASDPDPAPAGGSAGGSDGAPRPEDADAGGGDAGAAEEQREGEQHADDPSSVFSGYGPPLVKCCEP